MLVYSHAKVNLGLHILKKREDGFHELETLFYPIPFFDIVEVVASQSSDFFYQMGQSLEILPEENLCMKAYRLLQRDFPRIPPVEIWLYKKIFSGAGLGGGSSNAAQMLLVLNEYFSLSLSQKQLSEYAAQLGSDCPFFIKRNPQYAEGRGERLSDFSLDLSPYVWVIIKPHFSIRTAEAYALVKPSLPKRPLKDILTEPISAWKSCLQNDFETFIFPRYPYLQEVKDFLYASGALYAAMSGSGSCMFGIFDTLPNMDLLVQEYQYQLHVSQPNLVAYHRNPL